MSYTPTNWQTGDTVTAEKLNKMEQGIADSGYWIKLVPDMNLMTFVVPQDIAEEVQAKISDINVNINGFILYDTNDTLITVVGGIKTSASADPSVIGYIQRGSVLSNDFLDGFSGKIILEKQYGEFSVIPVQFIPDTFIVTLTPTAQDFSGTMDKTPQEITNAYNAGQDIEFDIPSLFVKCKAMEFAVTDGVIQAGAITTYRTGGSDLLIEILTDETDPAYVTHIYSLTPMS